MRLLLPGSGWIIVSNIFLYPESEVREITELRSQAARSLGGSGTSVGVFGSPSMTLAAEAVALSMVSSFVRNSAAKQGAETMRRASEKMYKLLSSGGVPHDPMLIHGSHIPDPSVWFADAGLRKFIHSGSDYIRVDSDLGKMDVRWASVAAWLR